MTPRNTNPGDYVRLDERSSTPNIAIPGNATDDNGVQPSSASIVQMQEQGWKSRAEVAQWAAEELRACSRVVGNVLATNYFGKDCPEGTAVYDALKAALHGDSGWEAILNTQTASLTALANACTQAAAALTATDQKSSDSLRIT